MSHARVEEVSDSDPEIDDPADYESSQSIISPANIPQPGLSSRRSSATIPPSSAPKIDKDALKSFQMLYPVYFDASRTRAEGRRVSSKLAVHNPLAMEICEAVRLVSGLQAVPELEKTHPKDWANPGRVRVQLRDKTTGRLVNPKIKNKNYLYILVAEHLRSRPPSKETLYKIRYPAEMIPEKYQAPAVPKGWKINDLIPLHSAAVSGGGVSENFMKDMMAGMQEMQKAGGGQLPPGMADATSGHPSSSRGKKR